MSAYEMGRRRAKDRADFVRGYQGLPDGDQPGGGIRSSTGIVGGIQHPAQAAPAPDSAPAPSIDNPALTRAQRVAQSKRDGSFDIARRQFNAANTDQQMDEQGTITKVRPAPLIDTPSPAPATTGAYQLTYQKKNGKFYGETKAGQGQEFDTEQEAKNFSSGLKAETKPDAEAGETKPEVEAHAPAVAGVTKKGLVAPSQEMADLMDAATTPAPVAPSAAPAPTPAPTAPAKPTPSIDAPAAKSLQKTLKAGDPGYDEALARVKARGDRSLTGLLKRLLPTPLTAEQVQQNLDASVASARTRDSVVNAGPEPGSSTPAAVNIDLPPLNRPVGRSRPRAMIVNPQL